MRLILKTALASAAALVVASVVVPRIWPVPVAEAILAGLRMSAGLKARTVGTSFGPVGYLEGGEGETVVLLHGIFARKEHWIDFSRQLTGGYRVVIPDLPGFGDNPVLGPDRYSYRQQAANLAEVLDRLDIGRAHLVANSMGARLAVVLAEADPPPVRSLALVGSPDGVTAPLPSDMEKALERGEVPLVVTTEGEYDARMAWLFPEPPFVPGPVADLWRSAEVAHGDDNRRIWEEVRSSDLPPLEEAVEALDVPALILWCREDRILHPSGAAVLMQAMPGSRSRMLDGCGHLPMLDRPAETGTAVRRFLDEHAVR